MIIKETAKELDDDSTSSGPVVDGEESALVEVELEDDELVVGEGEVEEEVEPVEGVEVVGVDEVGVEVVVAVEVVAGGEVVEEVVEGVEVVGVDEVGVEVVVAGEEVVEEVVEEPVEEVVEGGVVGWAMLLMVKPADVNTFCMADSISVNKKVCGATTKRVTTDVPVLFMVFWGTQLPIVTEIGYCPPEIEASRATIFRSLHEPENVTITDVFWQLFGTSEHTLAHVKLSGA